MTNSKEVCPRCGKPLAQHQWRTETTTGQKFPICQRKEQGHRTKIVERTRYQRSTDRTSIPISSVSTELAGKFGIPIRWAEKVARLATILKEINKDPLLNNSLVFMGGTALNFGIFGDKLPRLSYDLDFNFREPEEQTTPLDMEKVMNNTHHILQQLFFRLNYPPENVKYKSSFELGQYWIQYRALSGERDILKIEICYSRRIPLLRRKGSRKDHLVKLKMLDNIKTRQPAVEELCGEKIAASIKRKLSRDVFDIYYIARAVEKGKMDFKVLRKCALICILYQDIDPREVDWDRMFENISLDNYLQTTLINRKRITGQQFSQIIFNAKNFLKSIYSDFTDTESQYLDKYFKDGKFHPDLIDPEQDLHPYLANQSEIQWVLSKRSKKS